MAQEKGEGVRAEVERLRRDEQKLRPNLDAFLDKVNVVKASHNQNSQHNQHSQHSQQRSEPPSSASAERSEGTLGGPAALLSERRKVGFTPSPQTNYTGRQEGNNSSAARSKQFCAVSFRDFPEYRDLPVQSGRLPSRAASGTGAAFDEGDPSSFLDSTSPGSKKEGSPSKSRV